MKGILAFVFREDHMMLAHLDNNSLVRFNLLLSSIFSHLLLQLYNKGMLNSVYIYVVMKLEVKTVSSLYAMMPSNLTVPTN